MCVIRFRGDGAKVFGTVVDAMDAWSKACRSCGEDSIGGLLPNAQLPL